MKAWVMLVIGLLGVWADASATEIVMSQAAIFVLVSVGELVWTVIEARRELKA